MENSYPKKRNSEWSQQDGLQHIRINPGPLQVFHVKQASKWRWWLEQSICKSYTKFLWGLKLDLPYFQWVAWHYENAVLQWVSLLHFNHTFQLGHPQKEKFLKRILNNSSAFLASASSCSDQGNRRPPLWNTDSRFISGSCIVAHANVSVLLQQGRILHLPPIADAAAIVTAIRTENPLATTGFKLCSYAQSHFCFVFC